MKKTFYPIFFLILLLGSCAKIVAPSGGSKDITPPELLKSFPENQSTNFTEKQFQLVFDEFVIVKDINKQLIVSPLLNNVPEVIVKGKKIYVRFNDTLQSNTTYIFNFGNSIADFNEGNPYKNLTYVFSTGNYIDSLQIAGQVLNSFNLKPEKKESVVMLYTTFDDSVPRKVLPRYITRTDKSGNFKFNYLKSGKYYIAAFNEINDNYFYDVPSEMIAFNDSAIKPFIISYIDTIKSLSLETEDSIFTENDSIVTSYQYKPDSLQLLLFTEKLNTQYVTDFKRLTPYHCQFFFFAQNNDKPILSFLNHSEDEYYPVFSLNNDTIDIWIKNDSLLLQKDTFAFSVSYRFLSDSGNVSTIDTLYFRWKETKSYVKTPFSFIVNQKFPIPENQNVTLSFSEPVFSIDTSKLFLIKSNEEKIDTTKFELIQQDSLGLRFLINNEWQFGTSYKFIFDSLSFNSIYNNVLDSMGLNVTIQDPDFYGSIKCKVNNDGLPFVFQLLDSKENILREIQPQPSDSIFKIQQISPGTYTLKAFLDINRNGEWDTGLLKEFKQPEDVFYFEKAVEVKSGWEMEYEWTIKSDKQ